MAEELSSIADMKIPVIWYIWSGMSGSILDLCSDRAVIDMNKTPLSSLELHQCAVS